MPYGGTEYSCVIELASERYLPIYKISVTTTAQTDSREQRAVTWVTARVALMLVLNRARAEHYSSNARGVSFKWRNRLNRRTRCITCPWRLGHVNSDDNASGFSRFKIKVSYVSRAFTLNVR